MWLNTNLSALATDVGNIEKRTLLNSFTATGNKTVLDISGFRELEFVLYDNSGHIHQILQISPELFRTRTTYTLIMNSSLVTARKDFKYVNDTTINCSQAASSNVVEIYGIY